MYLDDLFPTPNSKEVADVASKIFGYSIDVENLTEAKARKLQTSLTQKLNVLEQKLGSNISKNRDYSEAVLFLEAVNKKLHEGFVSEINFSKMSDSKLKLWLKKNDSDEPGMAPVYGKQVLNAKKELKKRKLKESDMNTAQVTMASKDMVDKIQGMLEDLGEMINEDLPPLSDTIRDTIDSTTAESFNQQMSDAVNAALEAMRTAREQADSASRVLMGEEPTIGDDELDLDAELDNDSEMDDFDDIEDTPEMGREKRV